ncbi:precorrin-3B C(17)-methyltransferase [Micropruina sp.]|uniref:precorrin-3B C(17)-methyltransferase n=1 Tax=Micropruina sp. TaxID=2737536 RepID=UPI0039E2150B
MITVYGLLGAPSPQLREAAARADVVVGGRRHLDALNVEPERRITLGALRIAVQQVRQLRDSAAVVVIASGDPLFFGIVRSLRAAGLRPAVVPAVSSVAAAFAAVGLPWDDAAVVSVHGRPLQPALRLARSTGKVAVFTSAENDIRRLAESLADLERWYVLAERLGEADQQVRVLTTAEAMVTEPREPNVVLILDRPPSADDAPWPGDIAGAQPIGSPESVGDGSRWSIGQVTSGAASLARADQIDAILGVETKRYTEGARAGLPQAWAACDLIVSHLALGATTRIIAPLLQSKKTDPGVVVIDETGRFVVPLVGGHSGGANALASQLAEGLGATAVLTTATDSTGVAALDTLGWAYRGDVAAVTRAILDGHPVDLVRTRPWPLPPLPPNVGSTSSIVGRDCREGAATETSTSPTSGGRVEQPLMAGAGGSPAVARIVVTDELAAPLAAARESGGSAMAEPARTTPTVVLHPPSLIAGMGCNRGTSAAALRDLLERTLTKGGLAIESLAAIASVDAKADEAGLIELAAELRVGFRTFDAATLAGFDVPNPSAHAQAAVGTPSVSEAAVLAGGADLVVPKQKTPEATCAIGRLPASGKLWVVGLGPGSRDLTTPRAQQAIRNAAVVVGYRPYVEQVTDLIRPGTEVHSSGMGTEEARTALAIAKAREGRRVALVCSGDPAIYAMASPTLEQGTEGIEVEIVPGVTASLAVSAILGAPLGHDHATISLSDLHTSWQNIEQRLQAAAEADLVTVLYNPRSRTRLMHLPRALQIFSAHRPAGTPVAVVEEACRPDQKVTTATLADFDPAWVNMNSLVVIGSSTTRYLPTGRGATVMVTPRDYHWMNQ